jgi:hypothetical protein
MGDPLGQRQTISDARKRLLGISQQPFDLSANVSGADTRIMSAIDEPMRRMLRRIVQKAASVGVLASFRLIPGIIPCRPGAMMRLEAQSIISLLFGHPEQPLGERTGSGYSTGQVS